MHLLTAPLLFKATAQHTRDHSEMNACTLDVCGRLSWYSASAMRSRPKTSSLADSIDDRSTIMETRCDQVYNINDAGLTGMFTSKAVARSAFRRQVLHRCAQYQNLLPLNLPCTDSERKKRPLFSNGGGGGGSGVSSLSALPTGMLAWNSGLVWDFEHSFASFAPDR